MFQEQYLEGKEKSGWQYYLSGSLPKTNNNLEAYNRTLKDYVTKRKAEAFPVYFDLMKEEVVSKSEQQIQAFPSCARVHGDFYILATVLAGNYEELYAESNGYYYIKDPTINFNSMNKDKKGLIASIKTLMTKMTNDPSAKEKFLDMFTKPTIQEIEKYEAPVVMTKGSFMNLCKIKKISKIEPVNVDLPLSSFKCTCPNFLEVFYCLHVLGVMIKYNYSDGKVFKKNKKRGPKPKVGSALQREAGEEEDDQ